MGLQGLVVFYVNEVVVYKSPSCDVKGVEQFSENDFVTNYFFLEFQNFHL